MSDKELLCRRCSGSYLLRAEDLEFLSRYAIPSPTLCPACRQQRRASFRNSRNLYRRTCAESARLIVSLYSPDKVFKVFNTEHWWSDRWSALDYGREYNFSEPFFPQFEQLLRDVPRPALFNKGSENSVYTNHAVYNKNCYLCFNAGYCEDTLYSGDVAVKCRDSADLTNVIEAELLYYSTDCNNCYNSSYLIRSSNCRDSHYLFDCRACHHCFLCTNLRNKSYCFANEQLSESEYFGKIEKLDLGSRRQRAEVENSFRRLLKEQAVYPAQFWESTENVSGDFITGSKNIHLSFDVNNCEDLSYCYDVWDIKDCMDVFQTMDKAEEQYETHASSMSRQAFFSNVCHENYDIQYCDHCFNSAHLFGCVGLRSEKYCILNRQYSEPDFFALRAKLIEQMRGTAEYGEFFPSSISPFAYNETEAAEYYPLQREEALSAGFKWSDYQAELPSAERVLEPEEIPDSLFPPEAAASSAGAYLLGASLRCAETGLVFKLTKQELDLYRKLSVPPPNLHPAKRAILRKSQRGLRTIRKTHCHSCKSAINTSRARTQAEQEDLKILCSPCYLQALRS